MPHPFMTLTKPIQDSGLRNSSEIYRLFKQSYKIVKAQNEMTLPSLLWVRECGVQREKHYAIYRRHRLVLG